MYISKPSIATRLFYFLPSICAQPYYLTTVKFAATRCKIHKVSGKIKSFVVNDGLHLYTLDIITNGMFRIEVNAEIVFSCSKDKNRQKERKQTKNFRGKERKEDSKKAKDGRNKSVRDLRFSL